MIRIYSELIKFPSFEERFKYLKLSNKTGIQTFGFDRYINQNFYRSTEWRRVRNAVIVRDNSCDLGVIGCELFGRIYVHHMNPISLKDFEEGSDYLMDLEFLICVSHATHNAIHFGNEKNLLNTIRERRRGDTILWKVY